MASRNWLAAPYLLLSGCSAAVPELASDCPIDRHGFLSETKFQQTYGDSAAYLVSNSIKVGSRGTIEWNGQPVSLSEAEALLSRESEQDDSTGSYIHLEWSQGAPCEIVDLMRRSAARHYRCNSTKRCIDGPAPSLFPAPENI